jgi:hypothetical protein
VTEGAGWATATSAIQPSSDSDWYAAQGIEKSHSCVPLDLQCFVFTVRLDVPAGRQLEVCLHGDYCTAQAHCADTAGQPGPTQLTVTYEVFGTCGFRDDTLGLIRVHATDGISTCAPYKLAYRYDECGVPP